MASTVYDRKEHQGKGYGGDALEQIIETVKNLPEQPARLRLSYEPDNIVAEKFYAKYGFEKTGGIIDGEAVADLWFKR